MLTQTVVAEGEDLGTPTKSQPTPSPTQPSAEDQPPLIESSLDHDSSQDPRVDLKGTGGSGGDQVNLPYDSPLLGGHTSNRVEGILKLEALYALCTNLSKRVLALESVKDAQANKILTLKARIKKLEKRRKNAKSGPTKDDSDKLDAKLDEDIEYIDTEEALNKGRQSIVSTARPDVSTARQELSTSGPKTTPKTLTIFDDEEMTLADNLIKLKDDKAKDKGKGVLEELKSAKKMTKIDFDASQITRDEEIARQLEVELQTEVERERQREEQASMDYITNLYDEVQEHELITDFVPVGSEEDERMIRDINKKDEEESSDKDPDEEGVIDYEVLDKRFSIINWELKFYHCDRHGAEGIYYRIFRSDGTSRWTKTFSEMVTRFDRLDLVELYNLVM
nr:hypothetical protein [Tanacetum cinerariifolium]